MKSSALRFPGGRSGGLVLAVLASLGGTPAACSGYINGETGSTAGGAPTPGSGSTASKGPTSGAAGAAKPIDSTVGQSSAWYDTLKAADCAGAPRALPPSRIWRLSALQWRNTVAQALNIPAPDVSAFPRDPIDPHTGFSGDSSGSKATLALASSSLDAGDRAATQATPAAITAFSCLGTAPIALACAEKFIAAYGQRLFRRALTPPEITSYSNFLIGESKVDPAQTAVTSVLKAMLMSPNFLFRTELGNSKPGAVDLTADEMASLLSYTVADVPPDAGLQQAAAAGQLSNPNVRLAEAERLAGLPGAKEKLAAFWREYLALGDAPTAPGIGTSMYNESQTFFAKVVWDNSGSLKDLLTAPYTYADATVAAVYGTAKPAADGRLALDPKQRSGFLTSAGMLVKTAAPSQAATVIHRGILVRERVLCQAPPPPPPDLVPDPEQIQMAGTDATAKENYDLFAMTKVSCNACHSSFQPLGLAFESYDAAGKFRTAYPNGKPIITGGTLGNAGDASGAFGDVAEMTTRLGASQIAQYCFAGQFAEFAFGRAVNLDQEACTVRAMGEYVTTKGGRLRGLLASISAAPTVSRRFHQ